MGGGAGGRDRGVVLSHTRTCAGAIEQWLRSMGSVADPAMLRSMPHNQAAGDLLHSCLSISQQLLGSAPPGGVAVGPSGVSSSTTVGRLQWVVRCRALIRILFGYVDGAREKRERGALQADVLALERDAASRAKLAASLRLTTRPRATRPSGTCSSQPSSSSRQVSCAVCSIKLYS